MDEPVPPETGADVLIIEFTAPFAFEVATLPCARLAPGR